MFGNYWGCWISDYQQLSRSDFICPCTYYPSVTMILLMNTNSPQVLKRIALWASKGYPLFSQSHTELITLCTFHFQIVKKLYMYIYITKKRKNVFFFIFIMDTQKLKKQIQYTVQLLVSVIVALEIATPPNPYKNQLIVGLTILICLKYNIVERTVESLDRFISQIKKYL
jgi:hypothetical protein